VVGRIDLPNIATIEEHHEKSENTQCRQYESNLRKSESSLGGSTKIVSQDSLPSEIKRQVNREIIMDLEMRVKKDRKPDPPIKTPHSISFRRYSRYKESIEDMFDRNYLVNAIGKNNRVSNEEPGRNQSGLILARGLTPAHRLTHSLRSYINIPQMAASQTIATSRSVRSARHHP
jgi:hypothetical protein